MLGSCILVDYLYGLPDGHKLYDPDPRNSGRFYTPHTVGEINMHSK